MTPRLYQFVLLVGDAVITIVTVLSSFYVRFGIEAFPRWIDAFSIHTGAFLAATISVLGALYFFELYEVRHDLARQRYLIRIPFAIGLAIVVISTLSYWTPSYRLFRISTLYVALVLPVCIALWRVATSMVIRIHQRRLVLVIGMGALARALVTAVRDRRASTYDVVGFVNAGEDGAGDEIDGIPVFHVSEGLEHIQSVTGATHVAVTYANGEIHPISSSLLALKLKGVEVQNAATLFKTITGRIPILHVNNEWFIFGPNFDLVINAWTRRMQRAIDMALSIVGMVLCAPLCVVITVLIKATSRGPVFYRQERVGISRKSFHIIKFRTMKPNAEANTGPVWASRNDPRVTAVGKFLRRTRLDEIPQLWNILRGEMSFIGPRPERPAFVSELEAAIPYYGLRFLAKPGLSGWAQVNHGYGASKADALVKLEHDLYYLQEMSLPLNILILAKTVQRILFHPGS